MPRLPWLVLVLVLALAAAPAQADTGENRPELDFVVGHYLLVGRHPDSLRSYTGSARIERQGDGLVLTRSLSGRTDRALGKLRRASPGEATVLAFEWGRSPALAMTCLMAGDLDNRARLTCLWGRPNHPHRQPGVEAYFAREAE